MAQGRLRALASMHGGRPLLIGAALAVAMTVVVRAGGDTDFWRRGQQISNDIRARVPFEVVDEKRTADRLREAELNTPDVYVRNEAVLSSIRGQLTALFELAKSAESATEFIEGARARGWTVDDKDYESLKELASNASLAQYFVIDVDHLIESLDFTNLVEKAQDARRKVTPERSLLRCASGERSVLTSRDLLYVSNPELVRKAAEKAASRLTGKLASLRPHVTDLIVRTVLPPGEKPSFEPIYRYDPQETAKLIEANEKAVGKVRNTYKKGDVLVPADAILDSAELDLLKRERDAYRAALETDTELRWDYRRRAAGTAAMVLLAIGGLGAYTYRFQPRLLVKPSRMVGMSALLLAAVGLTRLNALLQWPVDLPPEFAVAPAVMAAAIYAITFEQRFALGVCAVLGILATLASGGEFGLFITLLTAMGITVVLLHDIRSRGKLILTGAAAGLGAFVAAAADQFIGGQTDARYVLGAALAAGSAALLAGFIVLGILPGIERLFGVATSLTLLEWCDASRPLLRRLAQEAPGTHSHSLMIGTVAEAAANAIGANGLLARVGALYHDIGKIPKREYFVENQSAKINRHDQLGPTLSLLVIVAHVKDGLEMARAYGLPRVLHQFIAEHHGTTVVRYFQRAAAAQAQRNQTKELPESEFRYPGPKPRSRESAVLMLVDSVEGAVRAQSEPTPGRIESTVHQVLMDRLNDGQFDDCDITMKELSRVEDAVVKALCAAYHGRIKYPKDNKPKPDQTEAA